MMFSITALLIATTATFTLIAATLIGLELQHRRMRRLAFAAIMKPQDVEQAWVSPPDAEGLRCLFVKSVGDRKAHTVAMDFEVDEIVRQLWLAGVHVDFEHDETRD